MDITVADLKKRLESGEKLNLIDVREEYEYEADNIGAQLVPLGDLPHRLVEFDALKDQEIIVHCRSGKRSETAQKFMQTQGYTNVRNVIGGILAYREL
ncbi:MAG: rhodanese-like domain-containing protein [Runella slithyformis]|nr:MAG: rhodanese-like domain-containing protein [Runella slithyformis]TAF95370.1 MAG: rhodanese-like domain-containing protein [Runella sp.]TAG18758.1 MAG: rhodanese-like domain-containing protein [Cytophagales bacterium]TAG38068.1 MAG: rhodanese-like domain-containing protein [Cytophagia bacterium]TAF28440.1 MAG: rhodanese-like domain-containing protein [Runella slithyformis]